MKKHYLLLFIFCFIGIPFISGQVNFREGLQNADPAPPSVSLSQEERTKIHQDFLDKAILDKDTLKQVYAYLLLFYDHIKTEDYVLATKYHLEAENLAKKSGNVGWQGWVTYRGATLLVRTGKEEEAIKAYEKALPLCKEAGDSLCMGECWEQLSALNGVLGDYKAAHQYFDLAMPLLEKYGSEKNLGTALNNFGNLLTMQGDPAKAIPILERGIAVNQKSEQYRAVARGMNNLALAYKRLGNFDKSIEIYKKSLLFNTERNFEDNKIKNYMGLYLAYEAKGDFKLANEFLVKRYLLKDSLIGVETQEKIADLKAKYEIEHKELELQKSQSQLLATQHSLERGAFLFALVLLLIALGLWFWYHQSHQTKLRLAENKENLTRLTKLLLEKNKVIGFLEEQIPSIREAATTNFDQDDLIENIYNQRILTKEDWAEFKSAFEKTYPGYLLRLRSSCPSLSESEERLFLFIKLNLNRQEAATILGISPDSVKKTRNRLRKRLELGEEVSLEKYIKNF